MALPDATDFTGSGAKQGGFKSAMNALIGFVSDLLGESGEGADARSAIGADDAYMSRFAVEDSGAVNAYVLTPETALTEYKVGQALVMLSRHTNTGPSTINISGVGVTNLLDHNLNTVRRGHIVAGHYYLLIRTDEGFVVQNLSTFPTWRVIAAAASSSFEFGPVAAQAARVGLATAAYSGLIFAADQFGQGATFGSGTRTSGVAGPDYTVAYDATTVTTVRVIVDATSGAALSKLERTVRTKATGAEVVDYLTISAAYVFI